MRRFITIILLGLFPSYLWSQVVFCHKTEIKKTKTDKWEKVNYGVRIFEFEDTVILRETAQILLLNSSNDSIHIESSRVTHILTMWFKIKGDDTLICNVSYSEKPFLYEDLKGCCLISGHYVQLVGTIPSFFRPTRDIASFSYLSHKINMGNFNGIDFELEEMGDDSIPRWNLEYAGKKVRLLDYYGIDD